MMTTAQPSRNTAKQEIIIRALSSITARQAETIAHAVQSGGRIWGVQTTVDYDGYLSILIEPAVDHDGQKAFFVAGTTQRLELFETSNDSMMSIASFTDVDGLSARLMDLISQQ